jgi:protein TonB
MNERFLIPAAVALGLHAWVFFGFNRGEPPPAATRDPAALRDPAPPVDAVQVKWEADANEPAADPAKGQPEATRPELPEPPAPVLTDEMPMPLPRPNVTLARNVAAIPTEPFGVPEGVEQGRSNGPGFVRANLLDNPPRTRAQLAPVYPAEARQRGLPGEVVVEFVVDEAGRVLDPHVLRSNSPLFDEPTLRAVAKWRFEPGRKDGRIVRFRMSVPVEFAVNQ